MDASPLPYLNIIARRTIMLSKQDFNVNSCLPTRIATTLFAFCVKVFVTKATGTNQNNKIIL
jgi:hypothetical protein